MKKNIWLIVGAIVLISIIFNVVGDSFASLLLIVGAILVYVGIRGRKVLAADPQVLPSLTREREAHYLKSGMTAREIELFRETMNQTKHQIDKYQKNITSNNKLKAIDLRHDALRASKALFKELVKEPTKLPLASHFLYTHLPNMVDLTDKFIEINSHEIKSRETYDKIEESTQIIEQMASLIAKDYSQFVADDLDDMDVELSIAKQSIKRDNE
ncbi:5-bromo-4-chloroindolyl phosphate hydrolysis family protein [Enterococcus casseliflavus]|uniref:5-bromo-4-chloroindolyl phosphate hydrolysis family protein n=1 Tax=Enterococcus casseliflavus TaxID=37734 RepID=UPI001613C197|nr:5-bromo-4-chloroindolyl phosphate hydrolysis family protein [Enterococcus casseliflavus]